MGDRTICHRTICHHTICHRNIDYVNLISNPVRPVGFKYLLWKCWRGGMCCGVPCDDDRIEDMDDLITLEENERIGRKKKKKEKKENEEEVKAHPVIDLLSGNEDEDTMVIDSDPDQQSNRDQQSKRDQQSNRDEQSNRDQQSNRDRYQHSDRVVSEDDDPAKYSRDKPDVRHPSPAPQNIYKLQIDQIHQQTTMTEEGGIGEQDKTRKTQIHQIHQIVTSLNKNNKNNQTQIVTSLHNKIQIVTILHNNKIQIVTSIHNNKKIK